MAARLRRYKTKAEVDQARNSNLLTRLHNNSVGKLKHPMTPEQIASARLHLDFTQQRPAKKSEVDITGDMVWKLKL